MKSQKEYNFLTRLFGIQKGCNHIIFYHCILQFNGTLLTKKVNLIEFSHINVSEQIFPD